MIKKNLEKETKIMNVELAKTAGFCFGVKRAVETVNEQVEKHSGEKRCILMDRLFTTKK